MESALRELLQRDDDEAFETVVERAGRELLARKWYCRPAWIRALGRLGRPQHRRARAARALLEGMSRAIEIGGVDNPVGLAAAAVGLGLLGETASNGDLVALHRRALRSTSYEMNVASGRLAVAAAVLRAPVELDALEAAFGAVPSVPYWAEHRYAWWVLNGRVELARETTGDERLRAFEAAAIADLERQRAPHEHAVWELGLASALDTAHDPEASEDLDEELELLRSSPSP